MAYGYTAGLEADLDRVAGGALAWKGMLGGFWSGFHEALEDVRALERARVIAAIERALAGFIYGAGEDARRCPACGEGRLELKASRYGLFVGCASWPACEFRRALAAGGDEGEGHAGPKALGREPGTGLAVTLRRGPHGHYVQKGDGAAGTKPARMSVPGGMAPEDVTLDSALALLGLPREVGVHPESGEPILAGIGRYGPWLRHGSTYAAIADDDDVLAIGVNRAVVVLADKAVRESRARGPKRVLRELGAHPDDGAPVWLKTGHFGPFVAHRRRYASLPKEVSADSLTLEQALELLGDGTGPSGRGSRRR